MWTFDLGDLLFHKTLTSAKCNCPRTSLESQVDKSFISLAKHVYVQKHEGTKIQDISVKKCLKFQSDKIDNSVHYKKIVNFEAMIVEDT